jgi:hypothetical protein
MKRAFLTATPWAIEEKVEFSKMACALVVERPYKRRRAPLCAKYPHLPCFLGVLVSV